MSLKHKEMFCKGNAPQVTDMPFKIEQADQMSGELLNALVTPVLTKQEVLQVTRQPPIIPPD